MGGKKPEEVSLLYEHPELTHKIETLILSVQMGHLYKWGMVPEVTFSYLRIKY